MRLEELCVFNNIVIQCHDNPDADAIGSAFALYKYFTSKNKNARIVYGGKFFISKCNLELMISELGIDITHIDELESLAYEDSILLTVDCQYGEGNVTHFNASNIAIIDHHTDTMKGYKLSEIRSNLGACATLVWSMLLEAGYDVNTDKDVATALYYGLFMDTGGFAEIVHPLDRDFVDNVFPDKSIISSLKNTNLSLEELETTGIALIRHICDNSNKFALVKAHPCDPNILGLISDLLLQVKGIELCVVYNELPFGYKLSIRSCRMDVKANDFVEYITKEVGNGGGHIDKAGGFISKDKFSAKYGNMGMDEYILDAQKKYFDSFDIIYANEFAPVISEYQLYAKKDISLGYMKSTDVAEEGSMIVLRTLEGDVNICASDAIYIMIDALRNVYPIEKTVFDRKYYNTGNVFVPNYEYVPKVKNVVSGKVIELPNQAKECKVLEGSHIYAKQLERATKVFTRWDYDSYMYGNVGDYLAFSTDNDKDVYIIKNEIMGNTYEIKP